MIFRESWMSKEAFLFGLYNSGATDLRLCYNYVRNGELFFSRWVRYDVLMELDSDDIVPKTFDTKRQFINKVSHRTIHPLEIVYDVDERIIDCKTQMRSLGKTFSVHKYKVYPEIESLSKAIYLRIERSFKNKVYFTGNKSYHIHAINPSLSRMNKRCREEWREKELAACGADIQKKSENTPIAIELEPHYRSGRPKQEVQW